MGSALYLEGVRGLGWMIVATGLFSVMALLARLSADHAPWAFAGAARAWMGALVALGFGLARGRGLRVDNQRLAWGRSLFGTLGMGLSFYVLTSDGIPLGDVAALRATSPIMVALLASAVLAERPAPSVWWALPLAFAGVLVLVQPRLDASAGLSLMTLGSALAASVAMLFLRRVGPSETPEAVAFHFGWVAGVVLLAFALWEGVWPDPRAWPLALGAGFAGGLAQLCMTRAYAATEAAAVAAMGYLSVPFTHLGATWMLGESLGGIQILGSGLVVGGGVVLVLGRARRDRRERAARGDARRAASCGPAVPDQPPSRVSAI